MLDKGVQIFGDWPIVLERWMENPPEDYLQYIPLWVQISKIPENYYTTSALTTLREMIGEVKVVAFDPSKPITQPFIRVQVRFNVAKPLRMAKVLNMGEGKTHTIHFDYEKLQKRCYTCKRLNHEQSICPWEVKKRKDAAQQRREKILSEKTKALPVLKQSDPLFGVLKEEQVGNNPLTGRPKIAPEVLEEMRQFLIADTGEALAIKIDKVQKTVREAELDPIAQKTVLRLEAVPIITTDLNKGKGHVFNFDEKDLGKRNWDLNVNPEKLMAASMKASRSLVIANKTPRNQAFSSEDSDGDFWGSLSDFPMVFRAGSSELGPTGIVRRRGSVRRRPPKAQRQRNAQAWKGQEQVYDFDRREGKQEVGSKKRKKAGQGTEEVPTHKAQCLKVIPMEGLPPPQ